MNISIITATYNSAKTLSQTIDSYKSQSVKTKEFILIDGLSSDNTVSIFKSYNIEKSILLVENDFGIYDALNKGIFLSNGDIIGILHSDDFYASENVLENVINVFKERECDGVYGDLDFFKKGKLNRSWRGNRFDLELLDKGWMPAHPTLFLKKEVFEKHGAYNVKFKIAADYDFILRIFKDKSLKFEYLPMVITNMAVGGVSTSGFFNLVRKSYEDYLIIKNNNMRYPLLVLFQKIFRKINQHIIVKL